MTIKSILTVTLLVPLVAGCAQIAPLAVDRNGTAQIVSTDKNVVFLGRSRWDLDIRRALTDVGFNVKRFASTGQTEIQDGPVSRTFNEAEARYGITVYPGGTVDSCLGNKSIQFDEFSLEVADLRTNDVVLTVTKGGWTGDCGSFHRGKLFPELAAALQANWQ